MVSLLDGKDHLIRRCLTSPVRGLWDFLSTRHGLVNLSFFLIGYESVQLLKDFL